MTGPLENALSQSTPCSSLMRCFPAHKPAVDFRKLVLPPADVDFLDGGALSEAIPVAARSFNGTAETEPEWAIDWCLGNSFRGAYDDPRRFEYVEWCVNFIIRAVARVDRRRSFMLTAPRADGSTIGAVCIVLPHLHGLHTSAFAEAEELIAIASKLMCDPHVSPGPMGRGKLAQGAGRGVGRRFKLLGDMLDVGHKEVCPGPHLYVLNMAVDPLAQGQRLCSKLMRHVSALADALQLPCYLETSGEKNPIVYSRFGYRTAKTVWLPNDDDNRETTPLVSFMVRPCDVSAVAEGAAQLS